MDTINLMLYIMAVFIAIGVPLIAYLVTRKLRGRRRQLLILANRRDINKGKDGMVKSVKAANHDSPPEAREMKISPEDTNEYVKQVSLLK